MKPYQKGEVIIYNKKNSMELTNFSNPVFIIFVGILVIWDIVWKGFALWKAARNNHVIWFVCIMILNTVGILPIVYILLNRNKNEVVIN